ncbi:hypothetical protein TanjilG_31890 [Lupinus angustifolius]|uniref:C2H2-type domain-containing protein n=1 Tax=Lupinus angustifolius TaxID=3871 RepID=A0A394D9Q9_LUPAN|nr:hypothetical protein TanjilG_31890 [Lupinus angustifolius]
MPKKRQFSCKFCDEKFLSFQALGGHQKVHGRERILSNLDKEFCMSSFILDAHPCLSPSMPNYRNFSDAPLHGAHMHPMSQMSPVYCHGFGIGYDNQNLYTTSYSGHKHGTTSNSWGTIVETTQRPEC